MVTLTLTSKGQFTLNKKVQAHLGVQPGQKIDVQEMPDGSLSIRAASKRGDIRELVGVLKREGQPSLSIEEINEAIEQAWAGER